MNSIRPKLWKELDFRLMDKHEETITDKLFGELYEVMYEYQDNFFYAFHDRIKSAI